MHARWGSCALRTPHRHGGAEWKGKEPVSALQLPARLPWTRLCFVSGEPIQCFSRHGGTWCGRGRRRVSASGTRARAERPAAPEDKRREEGCSERTEADECGRRRFLAFSKSCRGSRRRRNVEGMQGDVREGVQEGSDREANGVNDFRV